MPHPTDPAARTTVPAASAIRRRDITVSIPRYPVKPGLPAPGEAGLAGGILLPDGDGDDEGQLGAELGGVVSAGDGDPDAVAIADPEGDPEDDGDSGIVGVAEADVEELGLGPLGHVAGGEADVVEDGRGPGDVELEPDGNGSVGAGSVGVGSAALPDEWAEDAKDSPTGSASATNAVSRAPTISGRFLMD